MLGNSKLVSFILGIISIIVTCICFIFIFDNISENTIVWLSLLFLIIAEIICTTKFVFFNRNIFSISNIILSFAHIAIVLFISIIFIAFFQRQIEKYILLNILILFILGAADIIITYFSKRISSQNKALSKSNTVMSHCIEKANSLCVMFASTSHKKDLEEIAESLKYSDRSSLTQDEITILNLLEEIQQLLNTNNENTNQKIIETKNAIKLRSIKVSTSKRGNY